MTTKPILAITVRRQRPESVHAAVARHAESRPAPAPRDTVDYDTTDYVAEAELNVTDIQRAERSQAAFEAMFDHTPRIDTRGPDYQLRPVNRH